MAAIKTLTTILILLATFVVVVVDGETWFEPQYTLAEEKCLNESKDNEAFFPCKIPFFDHAFWFGDECDYYVTAYNCLEDSFVNSSQACDADIQKSIWKTTERHYEALFLTNETLLSFPECHCLLESFQKKNNKESSANTVKQCSNYKKMKECTNDIREQCYSKLDKDDNNDLSECMALLALYECYDDQFHNATNCTDDMRKLFWEKEQRSFGYRFVMEEKWDQSCPATIQYIDEKICNADKKCNSNDAIAFGIQSTVIGLTAIVTIFLKNVAVFDLMSYL